MIIATFDLVIPVGACGTDVVLAISARPPVSEGSLSTLFAIEEEVKLLHDYDRHKKCDTRQPICLRCDEGGFKCLGYEHNRPITARSSKAPRLRSIIPKNQEDKSFSNKSLPTELSLQPKPSSMVKYSERNSLLDSQVVVPGFSLSPPSPHMSYLAAGTHVKRPGDDIEALTTCNYLRLFGPNSYNRPAPTPFSYPPQSFTSSALSTSSPSDPTLTYLSRKAHRSIGATSPASS
ncbi:fungal zn(2)-Cys(6) binuclear cluster domain-containing protein [Rhizoctonia solani AG-1 IA]|uniref:Fungal zn(2)-Cys(6) binuclear cluster domain-containing protein n=1 Tax=Thanatephorus cucumeris (strain AG1-IA) TaxID=983506 RepID=L8WWB2_THACA|nr:fungal zn(2)-Cys(6) binuclear cluster domain-containing protein [Rhizoctonia solani AG-1 IA]